jgi:hypothetical protein
MKLLPDGFSTCFSVEITNPKELKIIDELTKELQMKKEPKPKSIKRPPWKPKEKAGAKMPDPSKHYAPRG